MAAWAFLSLGILIALPFMLKDLVGLEMPIGSSKGEPVADIGMTVEEVKQRSTLKLKDLASWGTDRAWESRR